MAAALPGYLRPRVLLHPPGPGPGLGLAPAPGPGCAWDRSGRARRGKRWPPQSVARRWIQQRGERRGTLIGSGGGLWGPALKGRGCPLAPPPAAPVRAPRREREWGEGRDEDGRDAREGSGGGRRSARAPGHLGSIVLATAPLGEAGRGRLSPAPSGSLGAKVLGSPSAHRYRKEIKTVPRVLVTPRAAALGMRESRAGRRAPSRPRCPCRCRLCPSCSPRITRHSSLQLKFQ